MRTQLAHSRPPSPSIALLLLSVLAPIGCDKEPTKLDQLVEASVTPTTSAVATPPAIVPKVPRVSIDDRGLFVDVDRIEFDAPLFDARLGTELAGKPKVKGEAIVVDAVRDAKTPKVVATVIAIAKAGAKSVSVRTKGRDGSTTTLPITIQFPTRAECSVAAAIAKDGAINVWHVGGGTAQRFSRGFAGPDLTLGSDAIRKASASCDSPLFYLGADDTISWGLTFDLALAAHGTSDAGAARATETALVAAPVPGRKVDNPI